MDKRLNNLGLAYRAKKIALGEDVITNMSNMKLVYIASDISSLSLKRVLNKCDFYKISYVNVFTSSEISNALGKTNIKLIGVMDDGFAKLLK